MGLLDALKKLVPKSEPMPWDVHTIRHQQFILHMPEGWRFTRADWGRAAAIGPADQAVELFYSVRTQPESKSQDIPKLLDLMRMLVRHDAGFSGTPTQATLPNGVLWTEASELKGKEQQFVVYVLKAQGTRSTQICLRTSVPASSGGPGAQRVEALRGVMRAVEWN
jgi:hypothetical protein